LTISYTENKFIKILPSDTAPMNFEIVIPTLNGARWLGQMLDSYRAMGLEPIYAVDSRTADGTLDLLRARGAQVIPVHQSSSHIENGIFEQISPYIKSEWVMRLDDDEFPTPGLVRWAQQTKSPRHVLHWCISRLTLYRENDRIKYSRAKTHYHSLPNSRLIDPQGRLYRHREVTYITDLHSPGFTKDGQCYAPHHAYFLHFDALLRSPRERFDKLQRYEQIKPRSSLKFAHHYLPEAFQTFQNSCAFDSTQLDELITHLPKPKKSEELSADELKSADLAASRYLKVWHLRHGGTVRGTIKYALNRLVARRSVAELVCTTSRFLAGQRGMPSRWTKRLHRLGRDLYWNAMLHP
jgi:glycosyltransferase involved in cell wall biosynthesis